MSTQRLEPDDALIEFERSDEFRKVYTAYKACQTATRRFLVAKADFVGAMGEVRKLTVPPFNVEESEEDNMYKVVNITAAIGAYPNAARAVVKAIDNFASAIKELAEPTDWEECLEGIGHLRFLLTGRHSRGDVRMDEGATQESTSEPAQHATIGQAGLEQHEDEEQVEDEEEMEDEEETEDEEMEDDIEMEDEE